ncbi:MAG: hypothetical protein L6R40_007196 [Gallowayella cf. fulva]|nr:MAG: hypothetical protein L6R40_007196 [Xanthomendoza cf. fulva]
MASSPPPPQPTALILSKSNFTHQDLFTLPPQPSSPLSPSSIRTRTVLIALTANNLGYAALGTQLHWYAAFPVPSSAPAPFNDTEAYGIVPAWGYAVVLESTVKGIEEGKMMWGCWPLSTFPVVLSLERAVQGGHWMERSPHREELMSLYNRYILSCTSLPLLDYINTHPPSSKLQLLAKTAMVKPLWEAAYLLNRFVFATPSSSPETETRDTLSPIHPSNSGPWTSSDADLRSTIMIIVAANSITGRAFVTELIHSRSPETGPMGILRIASKTPDADHNTPAAKREEADDAKQPAIRSATYESMLDKANLDWLYSFPAATRILIIDFGGRDNAADTLSSSLQSHSSPSISSSLPTLIIGVGAVHQSHGSEQWKEGRVASNASSAREKAMEMVGEDQYWRGLEEAWGEVLEKEELGDMQVRRGMRGEGAVEGGWKRLCKGGKGGVWLV